MTEEPPLATLGLVGLMLIAPILTSGRAPAQVECSFEHTAFAGTCVEQATPEDRQTPRQACEAILACLNDARCVRTYCQATTLRGGWTLSAVKAPEAVTTRRAAAAPGSVRSPRAR
jgi:hypothetical protein